MGGRSVAVATQQNGRLLCVESAEGVTPSHCTPGPRPIPRIRSTSHGVNLLINEVSFCNFKFYICSNYIYAGHLVTQKCNINISEKVYQTIRILYV